MMGTAAGKHGLAFFLVPDRLSGYFRLLAVGLALAVFADEPVDPCSTVSNGPAALIILLVTWFLLPWLIYVPDRRAVLWIGTEKLDRHEWRYVGRALGRLCRGTGEMSLSLFSHLVRPWRSEAAVDWAPLETRERILVKRAMLGVLSPVVSTESDRLGPSGRTAFNTCLLLWGAPLWSSYLLLCALLLLPKGLSVHGWPLLPELDGSTAYRFGAVWAAVAFFFVWREARHLHEDLVFSSTQASDLPAALALTPTMKKRLKARIDALLAPTTRRLLTLAFGVLLVLYLTAAQLALSG